MQNAILEQLPTLHIALDRPIEGRSEQLYRVDDPSCLELKLAADARLKLLVVRSQAATSRVQIELGERAELVLAELFVADAETTVEVQQGAESRLQLTSLQLGGGTGRYVVNLMGAYAESRVNGLFALGGAERSSLTIRTNHQVPDCRSYSEVRGLAGGEAVGRFDGMVYVAPDAQRTDAFQQNRNMLLSEKARIDTKPQLEIYADDVKCSHGATVGQMDQEAIYYLRQRGLDEQQARRLQLTGFADDLVMRCGCEEMCAALLEALNAKLDRI
ncbi:MAG: SufD family Fe-S cluster assembly protein [Alistipes sp.]|nr:SufD family Fe-S cluster assembly protein [Alistipes sp.]MBR7169019.1 SufD family Fe-S cluster assembly protein [Alistipes sp.]